MIALIVIFIAFYCFGVKLKRLCNENVKLCIAVFVAYYLY